MSLSSIVIILVIALILFGPEDLPVVARALGKIVSQVRKYTNELTKELNTAIDTPAKLIDQSISGKSAAGIDQKGVYRKKNAENGNDLLTYNEETKLPLDKEENNYLN